jgi:ribosomal protein L20A (L18A)
MIGLEGGEMDNINSQLAIPIVFEGEIFGVIYSANSKQQFFNSEVVDVFQNIANSLSWRVTQLARNKIDNLYKNSLNTIFSKGKIFEFKYYYQNKMMSNASLDNFINLLRVEDRKERLEIYRNKDKIFQFFVNDDVKKLLDSVKSKGDEVINNEYVYRLLASDKRIKYIKVSITKIVKSRLGIEKIFGTVQDVSDMMILKNKRKHISELLRLMDKYNSNEYYNIETLLQDICENSFFSQVIFLDLKNKYAYSSDKVFIQNSRLLNIIENMNLNLESNEKGYFDNNNLNKSDLEFLKSLDINSFYFVTNKMDSKIERAFIILDQCFEDRFDEEFVYYFRNLMSIIETKQLV